MVLGAFIIVILLSSTWLVKKTQQNLWVMLGFVVPSFVGTIVLMTVHNDGQTSTEAGLLISYYIVLSFWAAQTLGMSLLSRNIAGQVSSFHPPGSPFLLLLPGGKVNKEVICDLRASSLEVSSWLTFNLHSFVE